MTGEVLLAALTLPEAARVEKRVNKALLAEHGANTPDDKKLLLDGIEELRWIASLKPAHVGGESDPARPYKEIAVLRVTLRGNGRRARLLERIHRAVPHPVVLVSEGVTNEVPTRMCLWHKKPGRAEGEVLLDGERVAVEWEAVGQAGVTDTAAAADTAHDASFLGALGFGRTSPRSLVEVLEGWMDAVFALQVARRTGSFTLPAEAAAGRARREGLAHLLRLDAELTRLNTAIGRERQLARSVDLTTARQRALAARAHLLATL